jgi:anti-sigma regulatory factor (Ser/Thr protein kinase)
VRQLPAGLGEPDVRSGPNPSRSPSPLDSRRDLGLYDDKLYAFSSHGDWRRNPAAQPAIAAVTPSVALTAMTEHDYPCTKSPQWHAADFDRTPRSVRDARRFVASLVSQPEMRETGELLVSELTTNALRYAGGPFEVRVKATPRLRVEVRDRSRRKPSLRDVDASDEGGRGLQIVGQLAKAWGTEELADGKVVWFEL